MRSIGVEGADKPASELIVPLQESETGERDGKGEEAQLDAANESKQTAARFFTSACAKQTNGARNTPQLLAKRSTTRVYSGRLFSAQPQQRIRRTQANNRAQRA